MSQEAIIVKMLRETKAIATVGFSTKAHKPSHYVPRYLLEEGYQVIPVNPNADEILGQKAYPTLEQVPMEVDMVQLFRPSDQVAPHVDEAIEMGAKFIWMQLGIKNKEVAAKAREAGLEVIQNRCLMVDHRRLKSQL